MSGRMSWADMSDEGEEDNRTNEPLAQPSSARNPSPVRSRPGPHPRQPEYSSDRGRNQSNQPPRAGGRGDARDSQDRLWRNGSDSGRGGGGGGGGRRGFENEGPREMGKIAVLRQDFGFIDCCNHEEQLFFHFSEFSGQPKVGDEVEFTLSTKGGRYRAARIIVLPQGTVKFEDVLAQGIIGTITKPPTAARPKSRVQGRPGLLQFPGETDLVSFDLENVQGLARSWDNLLRAGDELECDVVRHRAKGTLTAQNLKLVKVSSADAREQGVINTCKEGFGFIRCVRRQEGLYFNFSNLLFAVDTPASLVQQDVEFEVVEKDGRDMATRLTRLDKGSVKFNQVSEERLMGIVQSKGHGHAQYWVTTEGDNAHSYHLPASEVGTTIQPGDQIEFSVLTVFATNATSAANPTRIKTAAQLAKQDLVLSDERVAGIVQKISVNNSGTVWPFGADSPITFFFEDVESQPNTRAQDLRFEGRLHIQDLVEFQIARHPTSNKSVALHIRPLPQGSVPLYETACEDCDLVLEKSNLVRIVWQQGSEAEDEAPPAWANKTAVLDMSHLSTRAVYNHLVEGEKLKCSKVLRHRATKALSLEAGSVTMVDRQRGVVEVLRSGYGFIKADHSPKIFFGFGSVLSGGTPEIGEVVEYSVSEDDSKRPVAIRLIRIGPEFVVDQTVQRGRITKSSRPSRHKSYSSFGNNNANAPQKFAPGTITLLSDTPLAADTSSVAAEADANADKEAVETDQAEVAQDTANATAATTMGGAPGGRKKNQFEYSANDAQGQGQLNEGDIVEFKIGESVLTRKKRCVEIVLVEAAPRVVIPERPKFTGDPSRPKVLKSEAASQPTGPPDGNTKGFTLQRTASKS